MLLRADPHFSFDVPKLVFIPKGRKDGLPIFVSHLVTPSNELVRLYHNVALAPLKDISYEFLFARFAWSIFPFLEGFLLDGVPRELLVKGVITGSPEVQIASAEQCKLYTKQGQMRSGSQSPRKRTRDQSPVGDGLAEDLGMDARAWKRTRLDPSRPTAMPYEPSRSSKGDDLYGDRGFLPRCSSTPPPCVKMSFGTEDENAYTARRNLPKWSKGDDVYADCRLSLTLSSTSGQAPSPASLCSSPNIRIGAEEPAISSPNGFDLAALAQSQIELERSRSDPDGTWQKEQDWLNSAFDQPLLPDKFGHFYSLLGYEVYGSDEDSESSAGRKSHEIGD